jgi:hypothetical protein
MIPVYIIFSILAIIIGVLLFIGTKKRLKFLVDPDESWWPVYSTAFIKKVFGTQACVIINYAVSIIFIFLGFIFLLLSIVGKV